ncbi:MAG TPA: hypothetical protein VEU72_02785 [Nitrosopumilaceae archaeon]|nr:hypothetical protein [Nitrosopumilaceae archaeon]
MVKKDSICAYGFCGTVYSITATDHNSRCPTCKSKVQNKIEDL